MQNKQIAILFSAVCKLRVLYTFAKKMKVSMVAHLVETGEMEKLKNLLKLRLNESGWREKMKLKCKEEIKARGVNITVDELVQAITTEGRSSVDENVKKELLDEIRTIFKNSKQVS